MKINSISNVCVLLFADKSDPIEKSEVIVQLPSSERLKPSYVHRYCSSTSLKQPRPFLYTSLFQQLFTFVFFRHSVFVSTCLCVASG